VFNNTENPNLVEAMLEICALSIYYVSTTGVDPSGSTDGDISVCRDITTPCRTIGKIMNTSDLIHSVQVLNESASSDVFSANPTQINTLELNLFSQV
jgi:hypothetical protein